MHSHQAPLSKATASRGVSCGVLVLVVGVDLLLVAFIVWLFSTDVFTPVVDATAGLVNRTLLGNTLPLLLVVGLLIFYLGGLRTRDVGLVWSQLPIGVAVTAGMWVVVQGIQAVSAWLLNGAVAPASEWSEWGTTAVIGALLGQLFGNALYEELTYRGFLFTQVWLRLRQRWPGSAHRPLIVALLISQALFAARHIPSALAEGMQISDVALDLIRLTVLGILLALLYVRTNNLFIVIGVHTLMNAPTALVSSPAIDASVLIILLAILLCLWPGRKKRVNPNGPAGHVIRRPRRETPPRTSSS